MTTEDRKPADSPASDCSPDCCDYFQVGWGTLHLAGEMAARNGTAISVKAIRYCPWCGARKFEEENQ